MRTLDRTINRCAVIVPWSMIMLACCCAAWAAGLKDFISDGCSLFSDGTIRDRAKWCECCLQHDIAYWRGGGEQERKAADEALRACVFERTRDKALSETMYLGVRAGGHPVFPAWYRWGYGWTYGRGYMPLTEQEQQQVREKQDDYARKHPAGFCGERSGNKTSKESREP